MSLLPMDEKDMAAICNQCSGENEREKVNIHKEQLLYMFRQFPLGIEYDHFVLPHVRGMIHSSVMGGNIFNPVAKDNMSPKTIHNSIEDLVLEMDVQYLYGGGFYQITKVRDDINKM